MKPSNRGFILKGGVSVQVVVGAGQSADRQTLVAKTLDFRAQTWALQQLMRVPRTPSAAPSGSLAELVLWRSRAAAARLHATAHMCGLI